MITDLRSFESFVHTKFRFAEREEQCILGECGPLKCKLALLWKFRWNTLLYITTWLATNCNHDNNHASSNSGQRESVFAITTGDPVFFPPYPWWAVDSDKINLPPLVSLLLSLKRKRVSRASGRDVRNEVKFCESKRACITFVGAKFETRKYGLLSTMITWFVNKRDWGLLITK